MKIGILTYHAVYNFGANLQALSTYSFIEKQGHQPIIIDFYPKELENAFAKSVPLGQGLMHKSFVERYFTLTARCTNSVEVANEIRKNKIDAVIIGSDAVTQHYPLISRLRITYSPKTLLRLTLKPVRYETNFPNPFWGDFLNFLDNQIQVAMMSVSCQNTDFMFIRGTIKKSIYEIISKLAYVSVRDKRTQQLFKHVSNGKCYPEITPDPVFAFNFNITKQPDRNETLSKYGLPEKYIILSFNSSKTVNQLWLSDFEKVARKNGFQCIALAMPGGINFQNNFKHRIDLPLDPIDWYSIIKYSSAYIGEKMHPIIVSIHNSVPFFSFDHYGILRFKMFSNRNSSKIFQILQRANLSKHRISIINKHRIHVPSPQHVFDGIREFDKEKCSIFSDKMYSDYLKMMKDMLEKLMSITNSANDF